jgi:hypothetical protein
MIGDDPYRCSPSSHYEEDELWLRLDEALEKALTDTSQAYMIAGWVLTDSYLTYPEVHRAASELMSALYPSLDLP